MRTQNIHFQEEAALCVFPDGLANLEEAVSALGLEKSYPVIVIIGDEILHQQADLTREALETLANIADDRNALIICGGANTGVMAEIGQIRGRNNQTFPLIGVTTENLVTWPDGPHSKSFLGIGKKLSMLAAHYTHFILVPGNDFDGIAPWIIDATNILSNGRPCVSVLVNGGESFRKVVDLAVVKDIPVIALGGLGQLANELSTEPNRHHLISVIPGNANQQVARAVQAIIAARDQPKGETIPSNGDSDNFLIEQSPTILSKRDEFKPINSEKSQYPIPESFTK